MGKIFRSAIGCFYLGFTYLILVAIFGENHPFTRYPMFSSFPNYADYYYVEDENGDFMATVPTFGRVTSEIKDLFSISMQNQKLDAHKLESQMVVAPEVGAILASTISPTVSAKQFNIIYVSLWQENDSIRLRKDKVYTHDLR